jgi:hypothetical protein
MTPTPNDDPAITGILPAADPLPIPTGPAKITGRVEAIDDRYEDPGDGKVVHLTGAIVAFPTAGGSTIGVATNLQGLKVGDQVTLDAQVIATKEGAVSVAVTGLVTQAIDVEPYKAKVTPVTKPQP